MFPEGLYGKRPDIPPIDCNLALIYVIKSRNQIHHRCLPRPTHSNQCQYLSHLHLYVDILQDELVLVLEGDVFEFDTVRNAVERDCSIGIPDFGGSVHQFENPRARRQPPLYSVVQPAEGFDGLIQEAEGYQEGAEASRGRISLYHAEPSDQHDAGDTQSPQYFDDRRGEGPDFLPLHDDLEKSVVLSGEPPGFVVFHSKGLYDTVSRDGLLEQGGYGPHSDLPPDAEFPQFLAEFDDGNSGKREDDEGDTRQLPILIEDYCGEGNDGTGFFENGGYGVGNSPLNVHDVIGEPRYEDTRWCFGEK